MRLFSDLFKQSFFPFLQFFLLSLFQFLNRQKQREKNLLNELWLPLTEQIVTNVVTIELKTAKIGK